MIEGTPFALSHCLGFVHRIKQLEQGMTDLKETSQGGGVSETLKLRENRRDKRRATESSPEEGRLRRKVAALESLADEHISCAAR